MWSPDLDLHLILLICTYSPATAGTNDPLISMSFWDIWCIILYLLELIKQFLATVSNFPFRSVLEGVECNRETSICGRSRTSPCPAPPGSPQLQIQASPQKDHQETEAGWTRASAPQLSPRWGIRPRDGTKHQPLGCRGYLRWFSLWTSRQPPSTSSSLPSPTDISRALQGSPGLRTLRAGKLWPAHSRDVTSGYFGRRSWGVSVFPPTHARGGGDDRMEWLPSPASPSQPASQPELQQPRPSQFHTPSSNIQSKFRNECWSQHKHQYDFQLE